MGIGLVIVGLAGFGFLAIVGNTMPPAETVALQSLYMMVSIIGPGLFVSLEQETNRVVSSGIAATVDPRPGIRRAVLLGASLAGLTILVLLAASPLLVDRLFGGDFMLLSLTLLSVVMSAAMYLTRGLLGASQQFTGYAATLGAEGLSRLLACIAIVLVGIGGTSMFGLAFVAGGGFAALVALPWLRREFAALPRKEHGPADSQTDPAVARTEDSGETATAEPSAAAEPDTETTGTAAEVIAGHTLGRIAKGLVFLGVATLLAQLVANLAPLVVNGRLVEDRAAATAFGFAFVLTRIPLLLFSPIQAMLLPVLTKAAVHGEYSVVRKRVGIILIAVAAVGLPGAAGSALLGPWMVVTFFGAEARPAAGVMALLGLSTVLLMLAQILQPALVAMGMHQTVSIAWVLGTLLLIGMLALPGDPISAAVIAQLAGPLVVVLITGIALARRLTTRRADTPSVPAAQ